VITQPKGRALDSFPAETQRAEVLVADDERELGDILESILEDEGYVIRRAADGAEAVAAYDAHRPDIVILDVLMPRMDGIETLVEIRKIDPQAKVVMLSGVSTKEVVRLAAEAGAGGYVLKPFDANRIVMALREMLG